MQNTNKSKAIKNKFVSLVLIVFFVFGLFSFSSFEVGSCAGVTWSYNPSTNTATASGSGTTNFAELVQADIDGGWGGVYTADASGTQMICHGLIVLGDGFNTLTCTPFYKQILLVDGVKTANGQSLISVSDKATFTAGTLIDATLKTTTDGVNFIDLTSEYYGNLIFRSSSSPTCIVNLYSCSFIAPFNEQWIFGTKIYDCMTLKSAYVRFTSDSNDTDINNLYSAGNFNLRGITASYVAINKLYFTTTDSGWYNYAIWFQNYGGTVKNVFVNVGSSPYTKLCIMENTGTNNAYFVDTESNKWTFQWEGTSTGKVFRQYTFNLNVLNGNITDFVQNATVQLWKDSVLVYEGVTNSSGMIPTQTLTYGYYQQSTGDAIQNATSPYYLVITHPEWQTYISRFYITEPLRLTVSMQEPTLTGYTEAEKSDYTTIILFVISTILCIIGLALTVPLLPLISLTISVLNIIFLSEPTIFNILLIILNVTFTIITLVRAKTKNN